MKKKLTALSLSFFSLCFCGNVVIDPHGYWYGVEAVTEHIFDRSLAQALAGFFQKEGAQTIVDFGCGTGDYVKVLLNHQLDAEGYDGNPNTPEISDYLGKVIDLSQSFDLGKKFDWVLSLEVAEHIPKKYEKVFIDNLHRHNVHGIVLSWALKGQGGYGHFNEQSNSYVKGLMARYGYINDIEAENLLRQQATLGWFQNTLMVFRKK